MCGSLSFGFTFTCHTPPDATSSLHGEDSKEPAYSQDLRGLVIQKFEGLLVADSVPDSIEAPILCQSSADRLRRLFGLLPQRFEFVIQLVIANLDSFQLRNAIQ